MRSTTWKTSCERMPGGMGAMCITPSHDDVAAFGVALTGPCFFVGKRSAPDGEGRKRRSANTFEYVRASEQRICSPVIHTSLGIRHNIAMTTFYRKGDTW